MSPDTIAFDSIDGAPTRLAAYRGRVALVVNVASKCGLTPQYAALEALFRRFRDQGFVVLGFPCNDFAGQEPGDNAEIATFCRTHYDVSFPMFAKLRVVGADRHPLYSALIAACPTAQAKPGTQFRAMLESHGIAPTAPPEVLWNFEKFLIGRDGRVRARFAPEIAPDDPLLVAAIADALAVPALPTDAVGAETRAHFHIFWDKFPFPAMLVHKDRTVLDRNPAAAAIGCEIGTRCIERGPRAAHRGCLANRALANRMGERTVRRVEGTEVVMDAYWVPLADHEDVFVHWGADITAWASEAVRAGEACEAGCECPCA